MTQWLPIAGPVVGVTAYGFLLYAYVSLWRMRRAEIRSLQEDNERLTTNGRRCEQRCDRLVQLVRNSQPMPADFWSEP